MGRRINWELWRTEFVRGDDTITLEVLSGRPDSPAIDSLKKKCAGEGWHEQRKRYREELAKESVGGNEVKLSVEQAVERTQKIIDTAEMLTQHNAIAKALIGVGAAGIKELQKNDFAKAKQLKPREILDFARLGMEMQRLIEGMATSKSEIDLKGMSDAELDAIIDGNA